MAGLVNYSWEGIGRPKFCNTIGRLFGEVHTDFGSMGPLIPKVYGWAGRKSYGLHPVWVFWLQSAPVQQDLETPR